ncbi:MAG: F0F1 ATP synthase subunit delta [Candidatus Liptonbacteria bacterium]|nr:F0F1 ATP synthase subunit delta [Candidatus Liptonbacteria bacterium]
MKYSSHIYAKALAEVVTDSRAKSGDAANNFIALLRKNGDEAHLRKIVEEASRLVHRKSGVRKITLESARPLSEQQRKVMGGFIKVGDVVEERLNQELIAGIKIVVNGESQFDGSLKNKLDQIFGN